MKRSIAHVFISAMLCLALCGCANRNLGKDDAVVGTPLIPEMSPIISPLITPDPEDGMVKDEDGRIEEDDTGLDKQKDKDRTQNKPAVSPSPEVTAKP